MSTQEDLAAELRTLQERIESNPSNPVLITRATNLLRVARTKVEDLKNAISELDQVLAEL